MSVSRSDFQIGDLLITNRLDSDIDPCRDGTVSIVLNIVEDLLEDSQVWRQEDYLSTSFKASRMLVILSKGTRMQVPAIVFDTGHHWNVYRNGLRVGTTSER